MNIEEEIAEVKGIRKDIDAITQRVKSLPPERERSIQITKLQEATMWGGMDLKRIGILIRLRTHTRTQKIQTLQQLIPLHKT